MVPDKIFPIRGKKENWYGDKEEEVIEQKKKYAKEFIKTQLLGSPDFEKYESFLVPFSKRKNKNTGQYSLKKNNITNIKKNINA